ncbi:MAG: RHS repeat-associated core domain-containing protein, partial [Cyanobacteria bacterium SBC]|nr:RHS repeat-associated core domain-containing protein [Cyanobacteria bacterium SBC]
VRYVHGLDLISIERDGEVSVYLVDRLGSTRVLTDLDGEVVATYTYDAFGALLDSTGEVENDYLFAGEQFDGALEQYYLRQRFYDAETGRFTRRDTYEGRIGELITLHKYLYGNANPVNNIDLTGFYSLVIGYRIPHSEVVLIDRDGMRAYGTRAKQLKPQDHVGIVINSSGFQGGSVGFGTIDTFEPNNVDESSYGSLQVVISNGRDDDIFPEALEQSIEREIKFIEDSNTPYNFHQKNSNATAFQVLQNVLGERPKLTTVSPLLVPGWNRDPITGSTYDG